MNLSKEEKGKKLKELKSELVKEIAKLGEETLKQKELSYELEPDDKNFYTYCTKCKCNCHAPCDCYDNECIKFDWFRNCETCGCEGAEHEIHKHYHFVQKKSEKIIKIDNSKKIKRLKKKSTKEIEEIQKEKTSYDNEVNNLENALKSLENELSDLKENIDYFQEEIEKTKKDVEEINRDIAKNIFGMQSIVESLKVIAINPITYKTENDYIDSLLKKNKDIDGENYIDTEQLKQIKKEHEEIKNIVEMKDFINIPPEEMNKKLRESLKFDLENEK